MFVHFTDEVAHGVGELPPPFFNHDLALVDLVDGPVLRPVPLVQEDGLVDRAVGGVTNNFETFERETF